MKRKTMTTYQLIAKLLELDPDESKKVCLEKVIYGGLDDRPYRIQDMLTEGAISIDDENDNIIKITMY